MNLKDAETLASDLRTQIGPACVRIEVAGSIRRGKAEVGDIDLVCIPSTGSYAVQDMFGETIRTVPVNHLNDARTRLYAAGGWKLDPANPCNGERMKRLVHVETGLTCDLTITDARRWGYWMAVRTGPGAFSKALVSRALIRRAFFKDGLFHNHQPIYVETHGKRETQPCAAGDGCVRIIPTPEEHDVFAALGLAYIEPGDRTLDALVIQY
jgi:DNA polymerase/3'-5' exonuclease PolX